MMNKVRIGDYIDTITDYHSNGAYAVLKKNVELKEEKDFAVMIRTLNFEQNDFKKNLIYVDEHAYNFLSKSKVKTNDILMNKIANPGSVYMMPKLDMPVSCGMNLFLIRFNEKFDQRYMFYNMKHNEKYIKSLAHGTTTKTITKAEVRNIQLFVHAESEQKRIADFLYCLDEKIKLLEKNISDCSEFIYNAYQYFVIQPGNRRNNPMIKLNSLLEFERGIEVGADNYCEWNSGYEELVKFYRVSDMSGKCETYTRKELVSGKIMFPEDIGVSFDGTVGKITYGICGAFSTGIRKIYSKSDSLFNNAVIYAIFTSDEVQLTIRRYATGSNILHAGESINQLEIAYDRDDLIKLKSLITPVFEKMLSCKAEIENTIAQKEQFLSLIMSGQVHF